MALKQTIEAYELLDSAAVNGDAVAALLRQRGLQADVTPVTGQKGGTDFIRALIPGTAGKKAGGQTPTLGIIGRLGGVGARPAAVGLVSDADGAITAVACALKLADMVTAGDRLPGDVIVATHICPDAPIVPHDPVPFMSAPVDVATMNRHEVHPEMDAILSIDTTRGNWVINRRGFAISPTVKEGYILKVSADLLHIMSVVTGQPPVVLPVTTQDITPYGNGVDHLNSIMQPATATDAPVVGVALTAEMAVPGCASGASQVTDIEMAVRFCLEVAKALGQGKCAFYDAEEFSRLVALYGSMKHLQAAPMSPPRQNISSGSPFEKSIGFSRAVRMGNVIAVSGTAPIAPDGSTAHPDDVYGQTRTCLEIMKQAIEDAGGQLENVVRTRIMLRDISRWEEAARAHGEFFSDIRPACTFVEVKGFVREDWLVETEADCVLESEEGTRDKGTKL